MERKKRVWSEEELRLMAREEAAATINRVRFVNQHLLAKIPGRSLDAIKGARRAQVYKDMVTAFTEELEVEASDSISSSSSDGLPSAPAGRTASPQPVPLRSRPNLHGPADDDFIVAIRRLIPQVREIREWEAGLLVQLAQDFLDGRHISDGLEAWLMTVFPPTLAPPRAPQARPCIVNPSRKARRRLEYARMQGIFRHKMSEAAREILDGKSMRDAGIPDVRTMSEHWGPFISHPSSPAPRISAITPKPELEFLWRPVSCNEVANVTLPLNAAPGLDGVSVRSWRAVLPSVKALAFNLVLTTGGFPTPLLKSRTVFIPKKGDSVSPADYRPISITSVIVRHLHKILANRLRASNLIDARQRCFDDGCAENVAVLAALLYKSRRELKELHVASLDVAKAYDSVSHAAITSVLRSCGVPPGLVSYVHHLYANSTTVLQVRSETSMDFSLGRGVRQGDPMSAYLFGLVIDRVLAAIPAGVGVKSGYEHINAVAYADDILIFASSRLGLQMALETVEATANVMGLQFNSRKCSVLSLIPAGKQKKIKVITTPSFQLKDGSLLPQVLADEKWLYLGVLFNPAGPRRASLDLKIYLDRLTRAPLRPQQRIKILRCFLIPRLYHTLVLGRSTLGRLRAMDVSTRTAIRRWLRLPKDVPTAFFHTSTTDGGLGIPSLVTTIPGLLLDRLLSLEHSSAPQSQAIFDEAWVQGKLRWARNALTKEGECLSSKVLRDRWWARALHNSVDGRELRECRKTKVSTAWIDACSLAIPGRDYVQHVHVLINALPTRIRTSRGTRRGACSVQCRAGCQITETAAHVIQGCHRTHGGRIQRHNAICRVLASGLRQKGWTVDEELPHITAEGTRKPDLVCMRGETVQVIDSQVVSGSSALNEAHERKVAYYRDNVTLVRSLAEKYRVRESAIRFTSGTISWRGVWSHRSAESLLAMGLSKGLLRGITTRVLQGSHTNWTRWNKMTTMIQGVHGERNRTGVG